MIEELLKYVCGQLEAKKIEYMLSGSIAMSSYAQPRFTRDIDMVINLKEEALDNFLSIFSGKYYFNKDAILVEVKRNGMFNIIDQESGYKVDFVVKKNSEFRNVEFERRKYLPVFGFHAWVVSAEDLIISKYIWSQQYKSLMQIQDIKNLLRNKNVDKTYIKEWTSKLNLITFDLI